VIPKDGQKISLGGGELVVPDRPIIPFLEGAIGARTVTCDFAQPMKGEDLVEVKGSGFVDEIVRHM